MNIGAFKTVLTSGAGRGLLQVQKHSPVILTTIGVAGMVTSAVLGARGHVKAQAVTAKLHEDIQSIRDVEDALDDERRLVLGDGSTQVISKEEVLKMKVSAYTESTMHYAKAYGPAITLGVASIVSIFVGHNILHKRNLALVAAYKTLEEGFAVYREKVREVIGEEEEVKVFQSSRLAHEERIAERGDTQVSRTVTSQYGSIYSRLFDASNQNWEGDREYARMFLTAQQNFANDILNARGHLFLNEVYRSLGLPHTSEGALVGWVKNGEGDSYVDFGISEVFGLPGYEDTRNAFLLDFNVDGIIYDRI